MSFRRILAAFLAAVMIAATVPISAAADSASYNCAELESKSAAFLKFISAENGVLTYDLCFNDAEGYGISGAGLFISVPNNLTLLECTQKLNYGSFITSHTTSYNPYFICWVLGTTTIPADAVTTIARLTFEVDSGVLDTDLITIGLSLDADNPVIDLEHNILNDKITVITENSCTYGELKCSVPAADSFSHSLISVEGKATTCTDAGYEAYEYCAECDYSTYETILAAGHTLTQVDAKAPTCTEAGYDAYEYCTVCDYTACVEIPATGHTPSGWMIVVEPTVTSEGLQIKSCTVCGDELEREVIPKHAHEIVTVEGKAPTCTEAGYDAYEYCAICDYTTYKEIPAGHTLTQVDAKAPTCTDAGHDAYEYCTVCDYSTYELVPPMGHTPGEWVTVTEPTEASEGLRTKSCTVCGDELEREVIPMLSPAPEIILGDADGNGKVNTLDAIAMLKFIANWGNVIDETAADVNGDGKLNTFDVIVLLRRIAN